MTTNIFFKLECSFNLRCWVFGMVWDGGPMLVLGPLITKVRFGRRLY